MFIPTEGIGSAVAKILSECGLEPVRMEFYEDRAVVEFSAASRASRRNCGPASAPKSLPAGPWKASGKRGKAALWKCGDVEATVEELADAHGVSKDCMRFRLQSGGFTDTRTRRSKFERNNARGRMSVSDK